MRTLLGWLLCLAVRAALVLALILSCLPDRRPRMPRYVARIIAVVAYATAVALGVAVLALVVAWPVRAAEYPTADVALILAVDVSASIDDDERQIQREGYAEALTHPEVLKAITEGAHGRILVTVFEWSDVGQDEVRVPWTVIASPKDAQRVAAAVRRPGPGVGRGGTSVQWALAKALMLLDIAPELAERIVVDVSGDGKDFRVDLVKAARDSLLARGATINALPILSSPDAPDLEGYFADYVIGGPAAFISPAKNVDEIGPALRRKLVREIG